MGSLVSKNSVVVVVTFHVIFVFRNKLHNASGSATEAASSKGTIDNLSNLQSASVYLFGGTLDTVVNQGAGKAAFEFYKKYVTNGTIVTNFVTPAEHS